MSVHPIDRRAFLASSIAAFFAARPSLAQRVVTRPVVSEEVCPLETIHPIATDGRAGLAVLRKPPGAGPLPAVIWFHEGLSTQPLARLEEIARDLANPSRLLAAGYVFIAPTYRGRDVDPQNPATVDDALAVVEYVRRLEYVDRRSVIVAGCSGGGDLALEAAARTEVCAVVAEEPASVLMTGVFNNGTPKNGERYTPEDGSFAFANGRRYYTPEMRRAFRAKLAKIRCPILIVQGDVDRAEVAVNRFNADVLIPELREARKEVEVSIYPEQSHCFCSGSGAQAAPASSTAAAEKASQDIEAFCRRQAPTRAHPIPASLITHEPVRGGPNA